MSALTNQEVLNRLLEIRDKHLSSGDFMKKNYTNPDGVTIFFRNLEELNGHINYYQDLVKRDAGEKEFINRIYYYV